MDDATKREIERLLLEQVKLDKKNGITYGKNGNEFLANIESQRKQKGRCSMLARLIRCPVWAERSINGGKT